MEPKITKLEEEHNQSLEPTQPGQDSGPEADNASEIGANDDGQHRKVQPHTIGENDVGQR